MQIKNPSLLFITTFILFCVGCNNSDKPKTSENKDPLHAESTKTDSGKNDELVKAPDFADPELKLYYGAYTDYMNRLVNAIQNNDEAATMKLFNEEGIKYKNRSEMDKKATAADEPTFTAWLLKSLNSQKIIVQSGYYKKFNEEYNKKVQEKFKE